MKSLFVRLFISFLLAMLISGAVFFSFALKVKFWLLEQQRPDISVQMQHNHNRSALHNGPAPSKYMPLHKYYRPPPPPPVFDIAIQAFIFLVVGGGICYLLAWRMSAPVRRLRQAVQQFATGDLTARIGIVHSNQNDEISELGADFNRMAEQIENLVLSQKQLMRDISHELRSPLARLQVALGLARKKALSDSEKALDRIEQEAERLNSMIGELLTLSLLESGTTLDKAEQVDLMELLSDVVQDADFEAAESCKQVILIADSTVVVPGNSELLRRVFENVVRNGVRYTDQETTVVVELKQNSRNQAVIHIRDHGPGVPDSMLETIFQPFYRVEQARDRQSGGTGIGLAITARTVKLHGGTVTACNRSDGGFEVEIRLPVNAAAIP